MKGIEVGKKIRVHELLMRMYGVCVFFVFRSVKGIRYDLGTRIQTCALPICVLFFFFFDTGFFLRFFCCFFGSLSVLLSSDER